MTSFVCTLGNRIHPFIPASYFCLMLLNSLNSLFVRVPHNLSSEYYKRIRLESVAGTFSRPFYNKTAFLFFILTFDLFYGKTQVFHFFALAPNQRKGGRP